MGRQVVSPVKKWPGWVTLADPLTYAQYLAFQDSIIEARKVRDGEGTAAEYHRALLPGVFACVERWELNSGFPVNVTLDNFPATPRRASGTLIVSLINEITKLIDEADELPNE